MQPLLQRALEIQRTRESPEASQQPACDQSASIDKVNDEVRSRAKIVCVGGMGNNVADILYHMDTGNAEVIAIDTDKQHLDVIKANKKILIGKSLTRGLGAGGRKNVGKRAAELARSTLQEVLKDSDIVFIVAGMGCGTGTGASPVIAGIAKEPGSLVFSIVTAPSKVGRAHGINPDDEIEELRKTSDLLIVLDGKKMQPFMPHRSEELARLAMDQLISEAAMAIVDMSYGLYLTHTDLADLKQMMLYGEGYGGLLFAECEGDNRVSEAARIALSRPLYDFDPGQATAALVVITGGKDLGTKECYEITSLIKSDLSPGANVFCGTNIRPGYEGKIKVIAYLTGPGKSGG